MMRKYMTRDMHATTMKIPIFISCQDGSSGSQISGHEFWTEGCLKLPLAVETGSAGQNTWTRFFLGTCLRESIGKEERSK